MLHDQVVNELMSEFSEDRDFFLSRICDYCHYPFVCDCEELADRCDSCRIEHSLDALIQKARSIAVGQILFITGEELLSHSKE